MADKTNCLRVVEFYSGLGGMHYALKGAGCHFKVVAAVEINTTANLVYKHNFPDTNLLQKNIEGFTVDDLDHLNADVFVMSPPCQPYTRLGKKEASNDPRSRSFLHLLELLPRLTNPPSYILMENVKGFETSDTRVCFVNTLKACAYSHQEFLLSPPQFGIPNSRLRYYLLAKRKPLEFYFTPTEHVIDFIPCTCCAKVSNGQPQKSSDQSPQAEPTCSNSVRCPDSEMLDICMDSNEQTCAHAEKLDSTMDTCLDSHVDTSKKCCKDHANIWLDSERKIPGHRNMDSCMDTSVDTSVDSGDSHCMGLPDNHKSAEPVPGNQSSLSGKETCTCQSGSAKLKCRKLGNFLEEGMSADHITQFLLPKKVLSKFALVLDIVTRESDHSCCFTKAYGHYAEGTGSVLKTSQIEDVEIFNNYRLLGEKGKDEEKAAILAVLGLRYFTPREVANLQCLPLSFSFPSEVTTKQQYRLLGNSLNVQVVAELLKCLLKPASSQMKSSSSS